MELSDKVYQVVARAVLEPSFRDSLTRDLEGTLAIAQPGLSRSEIETIKSLNPAGWGQLRLDEINARLGQAASYEVRNVVIKK
jgi:hypothetical protein